LKQTTSMKSKAIRIARELILAVMVISIPVLIIAGTVNIYAHSAGLYRYGFSKYDISGKTGISGAHLEGVAQNMADFFSGKLQSLQMTVEIRGQQRQLYNEKELAHMEDVRYIISVFRVMQTVAIVAFLSSAAAVFAMQGIRRMLRGILLGVIAAVALMALLAAWALIDFNSLFYLFHIVSFSNELWLLDPSKDYLIMMFTEGFFYDAAIMVTATIIVEAVILGLAVVLIEKTMLSKPR